jgi:hypothetical protein
MTRCKLGFRLIELLAAGAALAFSPEVYRADESGISFWLPGLYGSLSAVPTTPSGISRIPDMAAKMQRLR